MELKLKYLLNEISVEMKRIDMWQTQPPHPDTFLSQEPFAIDTMSASEWMQWLFLPRMNALLDAKAILPNKLAIHPYFEEAFKEQENTEKLLELIKQLDGLFN